MAAMLNKIDPQHGKVIMQPEQLKQAATEAVKSKQYPRATHMYTLAIDLLLNTTAAEDTEDSADSADTNNTIHDWLSLDANSNGLLHILLSNRSFTHFKCHDYLAAAEDANHCCQASPTFVKGYLRLIAALSASQDEAAVVGTAAENETKAAETSTATTATNNTAETPTHTNTFDERVRVVARGLRACGQQSKPLILAREALVKEKSVQEVMAVEAQELQKLSKQMQMTKSIADDSNDSRHAMAAGDYGSALAVGAHGIVKNIEQAEKYLKIASAGGDAAAAKNFGHLLLSLNRSGEASEQFARAAALGDTEAGEILRSLHVEADQKREEAMNKLRSMADKGDARAIEILQEFQRQERSSASVGSAAGTPP